jgi:hypothetical protein
MESIKEVGKTGETGKIGEKANNRLRSACDGLSPKKRLVVVIFLFVVFAVLAVYMAIDAINFGDKSRRLLEVEHIKQLELPKPKDESMHLYKLNSHDDDE